MSCRELSGPELKGIFQVYYPENYRLSKVDTCTSMREHHKRCPPQTLLTAVNRKLSSSRARSLEQCLFSILVFFRSCISFFNLATLGVWFIEQRKCHEVGMLKEVGLLLWHCDMCGSVCCMRLTCTTSCPFLSRWRCKLCIHKSQNRQKTKMTVKPWKGRREVDWQYWKEHTGTPSPNPGWQIALQIQLLICETYMVIEDCCLGRKDFLFHKKAPCGLKSITVLYNTKWRSLNMQI